MLTSFPNLAGLLQTGVVVTNMDLDVLYINASAKTLLNNESMHANSLKHMVMLSSDHKPLALYDCLQDSIGSQSGDFHKTVVLQRNDQARLIFISARVISLDNDSHLVFCLTDVTDEKDCLLVDSKTSGKGISRNHTRMIGHDERIMEVFRLIEYAADSQANVLIQGGSGTGKELVADAIHELSERNGKPLIKVNCSALSETLLESELFGHIKGSFTGAYKDKTGKFELAHEGTIFLDEIGEISPAIQVKLLRVIQEKTIERVGGTRSIKVDMRIIAATNKDLRELMKKGLFREDLFYRLNVFSIHMPALNQRILDIPLLVDHFISRFNASTGKMVKGVSRKAMLLMMQYPWPGNIRELQNAIEHGFVLVKGNTIELNDLPPEIRTSNLQTHLPPPTYSPKSQLQSPTVTGNLSKSKTGRLAISKNVLRDVLDENRWNQTQTALSLGISRVALWRKMKKFEFL